MKTSQSHMVPWFWYVTSVKEYENRLDVCVTDDFGNLIDIGVNRSFQYSIK